MTTSTQNRFLYLLGFRLRHLVGYVFVLPLLLPCVAGAQQAPIFNWDGEVELSRDGSNPSSSSFTLTLKEGEKTTYYLRLTKPLPREDPEDQNSERQSGWWVRIHVEGVVRRDGEYPPEDPQISWVPSVGWEFDSGAWDDPNEGPSKWRSVSIRALKDVTTPIAFMHDVLDKNSNCPPDLHGVGKFSVSSIGTTTRNPQTPDNTQNPGNNLNNNGGTPGSTDTTDTTDPPTLLDAEAPTVTIAAVNLVEDDDTLTLSASVVGGTYDTLTYAWSVLSGGGSITGSGASATYTPPDVSSDTAVEVQVTVTATGTGTNAADGTAASASDTEPFTVTDSGTSLLPLAAAPTVMIGAVASVEDDDTLTLLATVSGGTYDTLTYAWSVVSGGGSITGSGASVTYTPPDVSTNTVVEVSLTVTAWGTGTNARDGTSDTETDTERFTVIPAGADPPPLPDAEAPNVAIRAVASVEDDDTLTLLATVSGGTYDTLTYAWSVLSGGGSITGSGASVTYTPPDVSTNRAVEVSLTVTARGTGTIARTGTSDTETDTERFTVIPAGTTPPPLPDAEAPNVTIRTVSFVEDDDTLTLSAAVSGGTYDGALTYAWSIVTGGGSITGSGALATYTPPDVSTNTIVEVRVAVTARGTGTNARDGTSDTETDTEPFTVIQAGTDPLDTEGHGGNNFVDGNTGRDENGGIPSDETKPPSGPSSDATLKRLDLRHDNQRVPLTPRFRSGRRTYTAAVDSAVTQVTVRPVPNHPRATFVCKDEDDRTLPVSSDMKDCHVTLAMDDTVITVKVTAEDGTTMRTYRVTVTRVEGLARTRQGLGHPWLARFARTVGTQIVNVVGERFVAPRQQGLTGQVAGQDFSRFLRTSASPDDGPSARDWAQDNPDAGYTPRRPQSTILTGRDFLTNTAFSYTFGQEDGYSGALWGRGAVMEFDGRDGDLLLDGEVSTGMLGVDYARGAVTGGLLVSLNQGEGDYQSPTGDGELNSMLVGVYPYARVEVNERISAWGLFGHGRGKVSLTQDHLTPISTDLGLNMGALGVEGRLSDGTGTSGVGLTVKSDAMWVRIEADDTLGLDSTHAKVSRLRLMVEGVRVFRVAPDATLTPTGQVGVRHDEGDAETGFGLDMSAGIRYAAGRLTIEGTVRTLVAHEDSDYEEWGASGAIRMTPDPSGRGLSLTLAPAWGNTASKADQLWAGQAPAGLATANPTRPGAQLNAEFGYGMEPANLRNILPANLRESLPTNYQGILTPYAGLSLGGSASQTFRTGARWQMAPESTLSLEAAHGTAAVSQSPVDSVMLHAAWRW